MVGMTLIVIGQPMIATVASIRGHSQEAICHRHKLRIKDRAPAV